MTQYEMRQAREARQPKQKPGYLCAWGKCDLARARGDRCLAHAGVPMPASAATPVPRTPRHTKGYEGSPLKWCTWHHKAHARECFGKDATRGDGLQANCRLACAEARASYERSKRRSG